MGHLDALDEAAEERLTAALWKYGERVGTLFEATLVELVRQTSGNAYCLGGDASLLRL
jgi:hypothetical protein